MSIVNIITHFRHHWSAYLLGLTIGLLAAVPYLFFSAATGYRGIALMGQDAEEHYLGRIHGVMIGEQAGYAFSASAEAPALLPALGETILGKAGRALHISLPTVDIASKIIFPWIGFLLLYGLLVGASGSRLAALSGAASGMLASGLMSRDPLASGFIWARPVNPEMSDVILFAVLWLLYRAYTQKTIRWPAAVGVGALVGGALYLSPYVWAFLGVLLTIMVVAAWWDRRVAYSASLIGSGILALGVSAPYVLGYVQAQNYPAYAEAAANLQLATSHYPVIGLWLMIVVVIVLVLWPSTLHAARPFFIFCAATLVIALNQQVLTGISLQPGHFHWYITKPLTAALIGLVVLTWLSTWPRLRYAAATGIIAGFFLYVGVSQYAFYNRYAPAAFAAQAYAPLFAYLNTLPPQAVGADETLSIYLPLYTHDQAPDNPYTQFYVDPSSNLPVTLFVSDTLKGTSSAEGILAATLDNRFKIFIIK